jgi:hypothetical protein
MAFVRRKGNSFYLVHNVRRRGQVKQLHLARLGESPRITADVVQQVSRSHPLLTLDWNRLREEVNSRVELFNPRSEFLRKLVHSLRNLNLDLADLSPALVLYSSAPRAEQEIVQQLRLLRSTLDVKLDQFGRVERPGMETVRRYR